MCAPHRYKFSICAYFLAFVSVITGHSYGNEPELRHTALVKAISNTLPATVNIYGKKKVEVGSSIVGNVNQREVNGMGTGVILDESGLILTNHHVVEPSLGQGDRVQVRFFDGRCFVMARSAVSLARRPISWLVCGRR